MNQDKKQELIPKLRFPEFRDTSEWDDRPFGDLYTFESTNTFSRDKLNYETGSVKNIHYGDIHTRFQPLFDISKELVPFVNATESLDRVGSASYCTEGDVVFADASEDLADVGKSIELVALHGHRVLSGTHTLLARPKGTLLIVGFGGHLFLSARIRKQIRKEAQGSKVFGISSGRLSNVKVCFPVDKAEQQKIVDCLNSIDELIAGHSRKLDALRAHKKGLMQQLFPRKGETLPRIRFTEFREGREWEETSLGQIVDFESGGTPSKQTPGFWNGSIPWVSAKDMKRLFLEDTEDHITTTAIDDGAKQVPTGTVLMLTRGMTLFKDVPICVLRRPMSFNQDVKALRARGDLHAEFLPFLLLANKQRILGMVDSAGHGTGRLNTDELKSLNVMYPLEAEQRRIAECLSSLESLIPAQTQKLDALKIHKKGLMQQLFPSSQKVEA